MSTEILHKLDPRLMVLRGFDRRGACAALSSASATGVTLSGGFADQADFAVVVGHDENDPYGYMPPNGMGATRWLPSGDLTGMVLDTDVAIVNAFSPLSIKFDSLNAAQLSYETLAGVTGAKPLAQFVTASTGGAPATLNITIGGTIVAGELFYIVFLGNYQTLYAAGVAPTPTSVASGLTVAMNVNAPSGLSVVPFAVWNGGTGLTIYAGRSSTAAQMTLSGTSMTIGSAFRGTVGFWGLQAGDVVMFTDGATQEKHTVAAFVTPWHITLDSPVGITPTLGMWPLYHADGNSVQLWTATNSVLGTISPAGFPKLTGGLTETSFHLSIDFTAAGIDQLRQAWLTAGPTLNYDSGGVNAALMPYVASDYSLIFTNWAVTDPGSIRPLKVAGPGTVTVGSRDAWAVYQGAWIEQTGFYLGGLAKVSATVGNYIDLEYSCQHTHDLYLGTVQRSDGGVFSVTLDSVAQPDINTLLAVGTPIPVRKLIAAGVAAGTHIVRVKVKAPGNCYFDFLQAAVKSDVLDPVATYPGINLARDMDTGWTGFTTPYRNIDISERAGFQGDIDFFLGSLFLLKRIRSGGRFHQATITLGGSVVAADDYFLDIAGTSLGVGVTSLDTLDTLAQRAVNAINTLFVGVCAAKTVTAGEFTITTLTPINGFTLAVTPGASLTVTLAGDIGAGNEGVWRADATQTSPLNRAVSDYLLDFCTILAGIGRTCTVSVSQEVLAPEDVNTSGGAWSQRFATGLQVLTATGFGSWGAGIVEGMAGSPIVILQQGCGYITGNRAHLAGTSGSAVYIVTFVDADHYELTTQVSNSGGYVPAIGDSAFIELQTSQCCFNAATVTAYFINCYKQAAGIMNTAGLPIWLQFGEVGWWFFSRLMSLAVAGFSNSSGVVKVQTVAAHGLSSGQNVILAGTGIADGTRAATVIDATHFTVPAAWPGGTPAAAGTVSGAGMAYYDANTAARAVIALGGATPDFWTQDDDPTVHAAAVTFLSGLVVTHVNAIIAAVLVTYAGAKFELLLPLDVNNATCYYTPDLPFPQGGRLNHAVNIPAAWMTKAGSHFDRGKAEGLSWGATYRDLARAIATMQFLYTVGTWAKADLAYLIPWFTPGCPWAKEFLAALDSGIPLLNYWAGDHLPAMNPKTTPVPEREPRSSATFPW